MKLISHRGLHIKAPENTLKAFENAGKKPLYFGIECDIYTTSDGVFVIHHDPDLKVSAGLDKQVMDLIYDEIADQPIIINGKKKERIPSLVEFLDVCAIYQKTPVIEIKKIHDISQLIELVEILEKYEAVEPIIISFNITYLKYLRTLTNLQLQLLITELSNDIIYDSKVNELDLSMDKAYVTRKRVKELKEQGFKIAIFTVNNQEMIERYDAMGIDYITTDL